MKAKNEIVERLLSYIISLPEGVETTTFEAVIAVYGKESYKNGDFYLDGEIIDDIELMNIDYAVRDNAKKYRVKLDSFKYDGMAIGLPFHIGFVVRHQGEIREKQWWVDHIAPILSGSKFEAKINPTENENCVIVVLKEEYREHKNKKDHFLAVKPYKRGGYSAWMKMEVYDTAKHVAKIPEPSRIHSNMPHFTNLSDEDMIFCIVQELVKLV